MTSRHWIITVNNPEGTLDDPSSLGWADYGVRFVAGQEEGNGGKKISKIQISKIQNSRPIVGESGTHHYQIYLEFDRTRTLAYLKNLEGLEGCHAEKAHDPIRAYEYCTKDDPTYVQGSRFEWGARVGQGKRADLLGVKRDIEEGASDVQLWDNHFSSMVRYHKSFEVFKRVKQSPRNFKTIVIMLIGPSMTGKSTTARLLCHYLGTVYNVPQPKNSGLYWDGYDGQDVIFMDEFNGHFMKPEFFNQLCDAGAMLLPTHGAAGQQMRSKFIVLCTNYHPRYWWKNRNSGQVFQTTRRIDATIRMFRTGPSPYAQLEKAPIGHWPIFAGNHPAFNPGSPASAPVAPTLVVGSQSIPIDIDEMDMLHQPQPHWYQQAQDPVEWMDNSDEEY